MKSETDTSMVIQTTTRLLAHTNKIIADVKFYYQFDKKLKKYVWHISWFCNPEMKTNESYNYDVVSIPIEDNTNVEIIAHQVLSTFYQALSIFTGYNIVLEYLLKRKGKDNDITVPRAHMPRKIKRESNDD